ncbi:MAG: pyridoxal-dependent decarboxylase [Microbacteriaceae bacterium]
MTNNKYGAPEGRSAMILRTLGEFRANDAPTHGGRIFSYVYDSGLAELDLLAAEAGRVMQSVNGLDPTTYPSVARLEKEIVDFAKHIFHADAAADIADDDTRVFGSITSGGTASCLLAVKTARDLWKERGGTGVPKILAPVTVHAAFHKAAEYFGLDLLLVPVDPVSKEVSSADIIAKMAEDIAIVVLSAPNYPYGLIDPIAEVAPHAARHGISFHVDACFGGFVLPWWPGKTGSWDFSVPGVTSLSADIHKFGYAPKGSSVLLQRGRHRHRTQYFATKNWPGYPVVNSTLVGSKPASPLAAAWAIVSYLGEGGFDNLTQKIVRACDKLAAVFEHDVLGLKLAAHSFGPVVTIEVDESVPEVDRVDPHHFSDALNKHFSWTSQAQPGYVQTDGTYLHPTVHFTLTPVSLTVMPQLKADILAAADLVRGIPKVTLKQVSAGLPEGILDILSNGKSLSTEEITSFFALLGLGEAVDAKQVYSEARGSSTLPSGQAVLMALIEELPSTLVEQMLIEVIARQLE